AYDIRDADYVKGLCEGALLGRGSISVLIAFPEQEPIETQVPLEVYNDGVKDGVTTLHTLAFLRQPITTPIVMPIRITKIPRGRDGLEAVISVPKIANGSGSVTALHLGLHREFTRHGGHASVVSARCRDDKFQSHLSSQFWTGEQLSFDL